MRRRIGGGRARGADAYRNPNLTTLAGTHCFDGSTLVTCAANDPARCTAVPLTAKDVVPFGGGLLVIDDPFRYRLWSLLTMQCLPMSMADLGVTVTTFVKTIKTGGGSCAPTRRRPA